MKPTWTFCFCDCVMKFIISQKQRFETGSLIVSTLSKMKRTWESREMLLQNWKKEQVKNMNTCVCWCPIRGGYHQKRIFTTPSPWRLRVQDTWMFPPVDSHWQFPSVALVFGHTHIRPPSITANFGFFMRTAKFLVVLIVLNTNIAMIITPELKRWTKIAILRHMSLPVISGEGHI